MSNLLEVIKSDLKNAMKSKDKLKLSTLRLLLAEIEKEAIQSKIPASELETTQIESVIGKQLKKLDVEIASYKNVGRDTSLQEEEELLLKSYMPKQFTNEEIKTVVEEAIALHKDGFIKNPMQHISLFKNQMDVKEAQKLLKEITK